MDQFRYFHLCDHKIQKSPTEGEASEIVVTTSGDQIDTLINGAIVLEIHEVRVLEYNPKDFEIRDFYYDNQYRDQTYDDVDPGESYYDERDLFIVDYSKFFKPGKTISDPLPPEFYEPTLHNRIRWLVKPPLKYQVKAKVRYTHIAYTTYPASECPICGGKGWFVDILSKNKRFEEISGIEKIAQRVVKDLLTELGTQILDLTYGTTLKQEATLNVTNDDQLFNLIRMTVSDVEDVYLADQQEKISDLPETEILLGLTTDEVFRSSKNPTVIVIQIRLRTAVEEQAFRIGF